MPSEVQTAVRLHLPGELAKHAVSEGTKAVTKYNSSGSYGLFGGSVATGGKKSGNRSVRAGLTFPVGRVHTMMRNHWKSMVGAGAPVYLSAVLEYMVAEVLELAGNAARDNKMCDFSLLIETSDTIGFEFVRATSSSLSAMMKS